MTDRIHVSPVGDLVEHDTDSEDCICGPEIEPVIREDGSMGWLISHHSLDGREAAALLDRASTKETNG